MTIWSYVVDKDTGFAPFWGCCTLACCKPDIRKGAQKGDWVVGLSSKTDGNRIVYAMRVTDFPYPRGVNARPRDKWPVDDRSWEQFRATRSA